MLRHFILVAPLATCAHAQFVEPVDLVHSWSGENALDRFGFINRALGDVDGDGVGDIGVGSPDNDQAAKGAGKVYIYSGATGDLIRFHLGDENDYLGYEMGGVGDVNADGHADYVVGAPGTVDFQSIFGAGRAHLYSGLDGSILHTWDGEALFDTFGVLCAGAGTVLDDGAGDVDADGVPDILIGAMLHNAGFNNNGRAYVYSGATFDLIRTHDGEGTSHLMGNAVGGVGDLDGDGHGEYVIGASNAGVQGEGRAYVYDGRTGEQLEYSPLAPLQTGSGFGILFASGPGDIDQDGVLDIFVTDIGDTVNGPQTGRAYVFSGATGDIIHVWTGEFEGEGLGVGRGCGDVDFDGVPDLIVSAYRSSAHVALGGRTFVYSGATGETLRTITGDIAGDRLGWSTVGVEDVNADGALDYMISGPFNGPLTGSVYVVAGDIFPCPIDMNGDGQLDILDFIAFQLAFQAGDPAADCDANGAFDILDFVCFQSGFQRGC